MPLDLAQRPTLIFFSGVPGSGKSALAEALARQLRIPLFARDQAQRFLHRRQLITTNTADGYYWILEQADAQLALGVSCILDAVFPQVGFREHARTLAEQYRARFCPIYCHCSDQRLWRERWHQRAQSTLQGPDAAHWMHFTWQDVERIQATFAPWDDEALLQLDTVEPIEVNLRRILAYLAGDTGVEQ